MCKPEALWYSWVKVSRGIVINRKIKDPSAIFAENYNALQDHKVSDDS